MDFYHEVFQLTPFWAWVWRIVIFVGLMWPIAAAFSYKKNIPSPTDWEREDEMEVHNFKKHLRAKNRIEQGEQVSDFFRIPAEDENEMDRVLLPGQQVEF